MAEKYLARAREIIRADYSVERSNFLVKRLESKFIIGQFH